MSIIMKTLLLLSCLVAPSLFAQQGSFQKDFDELKLQREKAVAAAIVPIDQKFRQALEQMLKRATQASDLQTATKIQEALTELDTAANHPADMVGLWDQMREGKPYARRFMADGTGDGSGTPFKWAVKGKKLILTYTTNNSVEEYSFPPKEGVMTGTTVWGTKCKLVRQH